MESLQKTKYHVIYVHVSVFCVLWEIHNIISLDDCNNYV